MGKSALTSWLVIAGKDFKILFKNRSLFLIFMGVLAALITLAIIQGTFIKETIYTWLDADKYLPMLPNYMIYFVIFTSTLYMMNQGPASFTNEYQTGTIDRLKIQNVSIFSLSAGKIVFFYLIAIILTLIFNGLATYFFWDKGITPMNWTVSNALVHILLWPLGMVLGAYIVYLIISLINFYSKKR